MRHFTTGATRNSDEDKYDYEGFLSPLVIQRYGEYMHKHRIQADGKLRDSDNWQKGIPKDAYIKSLIRHVHTLWYNGRYGETQQKETTEDTICAILFNAQGLLFEILSERSGIRPTSPFVSPREETSCKGALCKLLGEKLCKGNGKQAL